AHTTQTPPNPRRDTHTRTRTHTHAHTDTHPHTHTHTHTQTHTLAHLPYMHTAGGRVLTRRCCSGWLLFMGVRTGLCRVRDSSTNTQQAPQEPTNTKTQPHTHTHRTHTT